ncbi:hypothetical protein BJ138DRAFT_1152771 [Hygrophoropsis aurantiaca]|uniref:Uncharacterized protein n=1 Tax=Hygrophoropsis aurantiaca TaxID=72124 RepID=A0ACB8AB05_9AGAM|nr:hypothetical protein BJ138DRAFT_1152771 [Hygrophoropsis aurantiaca]
MLQNLPVELLCKIINNLPIETILLLRRVSKDIKQVTYDRSIWDYAYRTSSLVRPPGPFAWQTAHAIESNLIRSARLSLNWPPNPDAKPLLSRVRNISALPQQFVTLGGRWLLIRNVRDDTRILCYDLEGTEGVATEENYSTLYQCSEQEGTIQDIYGRQTFLGERNGDENHPIGYLVIVVYNAALSLRKRALYKVTIARETSLSLRLVIQTDVATPRSWAKMAIGPRSVAFYESGTTPQGVVLVDIETHQRYELPQCASQSAKQLIPEGNYEFTTFTILVSSTHLLLMRRYGGGSGPFKEPYIGTYIQAYAIPAPKASGTAFKVLPSTSVTLQLSHQGIIPNDICDRDGCILLRDSQLNHLTDAISIAFTIFAPHWEFIYTIALTLDVALQGVGSISLSAHEGRIPLQQAGSFAIMPSLNGCTRGVVCFGRYGTLHLAGFVLDDEDKANTQSAVVQDMKWLCDRQLDAGEYRLGFDASGGRIILVSADDKTLKILDFV